MRLTRTSPPIPRLARIAAGVLALLLSNGVAATFPLTVTNAAQGPNPVTFTLIEADGLNSSGTPGNTVRIASLGSLFSSATQTVIAVQWQTNLTAGSWAAQTDEHFGHAAHQCNLAPHDERDILLPRRSQPPGWQLILESIIMSKISQL
jgi:hypothetical protein